MNWSDFAVQLDENPSEGGDVILLDGALGTELQRRGVNTDRSSWTATALLSHADLVEQIHREYIAAGAKIITANTFRTHRRNLKPEGLEHRAEELTQLAIDIAKSAAGDSAIVAGSLAPLEDCYRPDLRPVEQQLRIEHGNQADILANSAADLILVETQNSLGEAIIATEAAKRTGLPFFVSFVCGSNGRLLSGESIVTAGQRVQELQPNAILANCLPATIAANAVSSLRRAAPKLPIGVYPNTGQFGGDGTWIETEAKVPEHFAKLAEGWRNAGATLIGGCCGTTPDHIAHLHKTLLG